jgi:D-glucosaminate-6-phosphate ammonia-lyase
MWSRRQFLEKVSAVPVLGGLVGGSSSVAGAAGVAAAAGNGPGREYFKELGIRPFINAAGTFTSMTASLMPPEVISAYTYASQHFVMLPELQEKVGDRIATLLRCEAAMVTSGAASALTLGTAAVLTGGDKAKIVALPNLDGMKSEVIIQKSHRFEYDHAVRNCGVRMVEVETAQELERAIGDKTAMMLFYNNQNPVGKIKDHEFAQLGKKHGIPTFNDAAADTPPVENLWRYTGMGFDLVAFSGGKGILGPQSAGLLLGRKSLIEAARLNGPPNSDSIGRGMKVNKEEILGMLVAVERFLAQDHAANHREYERRANVIKAAVETVPGVTAEVFVPEIANHVPHLRVRWDAAAKGLSTDDVVKALQTGEPPIMTRPQEGVFVAGVWMLRPGEETIVARRLKEILARKA